MSNTESDYSDSPRAFEGELTSESLTTELESANFEGTEVRKGYRFWEHFKPSGGSSGWLSAVDIWSSSQGDRG